MREDKLIILNFNHCRYISNSLFNKKKKYRTQNFQVFDHLKCLRPLYFLCMANYLFSVIHGLTSVCQVFLFGFITAGQVKLLCVCLLLSCADIGTIFNHNSKYNLISILLVKNSGKLFYYLVTCAILFLGISIVSFELFYQTENFGSFKDTMVTLSCMMFGDSVMDILDSLTDVSRLSIVVLLVFLFIFFLNVLQIFLAVTSVGFQRIQEDFTQLEEERRQKLHELETFSENFRRSKTRRILLQKFDYEEELNTFVSYQITKSVSSLGLKRVKSQQSQSDPDQRVFTSESSLKAKDPLDLFIFRKQESLRLQSEHTIDQPFAPSGLGCITTLNPENSNILESIIRGKGNPY